MKPGSEILSGAFVAEARADEYVGEDGVIRCKTCHAPRRQTVVLATGEKAEIPVRCPCQEAEFKRAAEASEANRMAEREERRKRMIPTETYRSYRSYRFERDDGQTPEVTAIARRYAERFEAMKANGWGIVFCGSAGTGKTYLAMCIANALVDAGRAIRCVTPAEVVALAQDFDRAEQHFQKLMATECIFLDDLGTERLTDFGSEQMFRFIDGAYVRRKPLVITTNFMKRELMDKADGKGSTAEARIYDRILERCTTVRLEAVHRRARIRAQEIPELNALLKG